MLPRNDSDWMDEEAFEHIYPVYLNRIRSLASHRVSRPFAIAQLPVCPETTPPSEQDAPTGEETRQAIESLLQENHFELWSGNGISIGTCGTGRPDIDPEFAPKNVSGYPRLLYAIVSGRISPSGMSIPSA